MKRGSSHTCVSAPAWTAAPKTAIRFAYSVVNQASAACLSANSGSSAGGRPADTSRTGDRYDIAASAAAAAWT